MDGSHALCHDPALRSRTPVLSLRRGLTVVFFALVACLLVSQARAIHWEDVLGALQEYPPPRTAITAVIDLDVDSFLLYRCFDLIGRRYTGHRLSVPTVMLVTAVSYAFNLNLGSWVSGVAFRYHLYARLGFTTGTITTIMSLSMLSNWMGYVLLAGLVFGFMSPTPAGARGLQQRRPALGRFYVAGGGGGLPGPVRFLAQTGLFCSRIGDRPPVGAHGRQGIHPPGAQDRAHPASAGRRVHASAGWQAHDLIA